MMKLMLSVIVAAAAAGTARSQTPDPSVMSYSLPDRIAWTGDPAKGPLIAKLWGDPAKPGPYAILVKWPPRRLSRPHTHPYDRHITVLSGVWWVGTGKIYDPDKTTPLPAGSVATHFAGQPHYDGAKDDPAVLEIVGQGPATTTPVR
jgi:hypothetical protein